MAQFGRLLSRFAKDESGAFAIIFGLLAIIMVALGGSVVDYVALEQTKGRAQTAIDAAALALQPEMFLPGMTEESIRERAEALVLERIGDVALVEASVDEVDMDIEAGRLFLSGSFTVPTMFVSMVGVTELTSSFSAEAVRGAVNIEVSVALDVTGSMAGQRIIDLRSAVNGLIDAIVQDDQDPNYSKMALVPYSQAVNAGSTYATALRGPIRQARPLSSIAWSTGSTKTITATTKHNPVRVTSTAHGFVAGDWVYIWNVNGMTQLNNRAYQVTTVTANQFRLQGVDGSSYSDYSSGGSVVKCLVANCATVFTSNGHGYNNNDIVYVTDVAGSTLGSSINQRVFQVTNAATNTFQLNNYSMIGNGTHTANTGNVHCTWQTAAEGCSYYLYQSQYGNWNIAQATNCVTERAINPFNDQPPTTTFVGRNYPSSGNGCITNTIVPLTANKTTLHTMANSLVAAGSTSGSLGTLWAWYMLSPNFGYVWPENSRPAAYLSRNLLKAAIIMTDGDYNTVHCNGVVAKNSGSGSGSVYEQIGCDAPNGNSDAQARRYCDEMKATGIVVYTVGFGITTGSTQANLLTYCASGAQNAYLASNGAGLTAAFQRIARNISTLRLTQ